jgi:[acyl-carrier-protein] S-malonyltransferase
MGVDVAAAFEPAGELFERAARVLGYDLLALCREGPEETLRETRFAQPAIFVTNCALFAALGPAFAPTVTAGHSFGEYCSLVVAEALAFDDALALVDARGKAMHAAAGLAAGGMSAVLGLDIAAIETAVAQARDEGAGRVQLANFNAPTQIVISGDLEAVRRAGDLCLAAGAKRVVPLNVSGAWHSELMAPALATFAPKIAAAHLRMPRFTVISNVDATPYRDVDHIRTNLVRSITHEVLWHAASLALLETGVDAVVEFGASPVLGPMLRRVAGAPATILSVSDRSGVDKLRSTLPASV